jgi:hypothetical protein
MIRCEIKGAAGTFFTPESAENLAVKTIVLKFSRLAIVAAIFLFATDNLACAAALGPCKRFEVQANDAQARRIRGDLAGAQAVVNQILRIDPADFRANYTQALIYMDQSGIDKGPSGYDKQKFQAGLDRLQATAHLLEAMNGPCLETAKANGWYSIYNTLGVYYFNSGDAKSAERVWLAAETKLSLMTPKTQYLLLNNLGLLYRQDHLNKPALSSAYYLKALILQRTQKNYALSPATPVTRLIPKFSIKPAAK